MSPLRTMLVMAGALLMTGCDDLCGNQVVAEVASPSGERRAVVFLRDCGAATSFYTHAAILPRQEPLPSGKGNTYCGGLTRKVHAINPVWESDERVVLHYEPKGAGPPRETEVDGVTVICR